MSDKIQPTEPSFDPKGASRYLNEKGLPFTESTLASWRSRKQPPKYSILRRRVFYLKSDLDAFIASAHTHCQAKPSTRDLLLDQYEVELRKTEEHQKNEIDFDDLREQIRDEILLELREELQLTDNSETTSEVTR
jgi:hypothetical protein